MGRVGYTPWTVTTVTDIGVVANDGFLQPNHFHYSDCLHCLKTTYTFCILYLFEDTILFWLSESSGVGKKAHDGRRVFKEFVSQDGIERMGHTPLTATTTRAPAVLTTDLGKLDKQ